MLQGALLFLGGVLAAIPGYFFAIWLYDLLRRPRLRILPDVPMRSAEMVDHVLIVENTGRSAAKNCVGIIALDATAGDVITKATAELGAFRKIFGGEEVSAGRVHYHLTKENFRPVLREKTCWADIPNPVAITINPKLASGLEIYRVALPDRQLIFPSEGGWQHVRMVLEPREYRGWVVVSAENAKPVERTFRVIPEADDMRLELT